MPSTKKITIFVSILAIAAIIAILYAYFRNSIATSIDTSQAVATTSTSHTVLSNVQTKTIHTKIGDFTDSFYGLVQEQVSAAPLVYKVQEITQYEASSRKFSNTGKIVSIEWIGSGAPLRVGEPYVFYANYNSGTGWYEVPAIQGFPSPGEQ